VSFDGEAVPLGNNEIWQFRASGLTPGTAYEYAVEIDGQEDQGRRGSLMTFANGPMSFTVATGSCMRTGSDGMVFDRVREADPLFLVIPGDFTYENLHTTDPRDFLDAYSRNLRSAPQEALYLKTPFVYVWDDHDFGGNDSDASSVSRTAARQAYSAFVPHYDLPAGEGGAIYQAFTVGRVRFILTDNRSERSPDGGPGGRPTMLGAEQLAWLQRELLAARDTHALTVWVNGVPWIAEANAGSDNWGGYAAEREAIANFIAENGIDNLAMISGDAHMVAIDDGTNSNYATTGDGTGFPVLHAAALDRRGTVKGGPYSEGAYPGGGQFALMEVQDDGESGITVTWTGMNWEGEQLVSYEFTVGGERATATP
jgi:phosphodiesterase/alkaline phosphatase D-like protein